MTDFTPIQQAAEWLRTRSKIVILTGAGVSKESGVPTFRDTIDGLWAKYDPQQLATKAAFQANPKLVWDWYEYRRGLVRQAQPNPGHIALADLEKRFTELILITQNVDDLHERAGSQNIIHLHGNIAQSKCFFDCQGSPTLIDITQITWDQSSGPPPCPHCGRWVRPDVVWFGEMLPAKALDAAYHASRTADVMFVIGTSGMVEPAASLPRITQAAGAKVIEINPDTSMLSRYVDLKLTGTSGIILPQIIEVLNHA